MLLFKRDKSINIASETPVSTSLTKTHSLIRDSGRTGGGDSGIFFWEIPSGVDTVSRYGVLIAKVPRIREVREKRSHFLLKL